MGGRPVNAKTVMCWLGLLAGTAVSVVANVEHMNGPKDGKFPVAEILGASVPVLMAFAVHLSERVTNKFGMGVAWAAVLLAFLVSYESSFDLVNSWGMSDFQAALFPLVPECVMIVALMGLTEEVKRREADRTLSAPSPVRPTIKVASAPVPQRTAVAHALSSDPKPAVLSAPAEDKPKAIVRPRTAPGDNEARLSAAQKIVDELGGVPSRAVLVTLLKDQGFKIGSQAAADLTRELKAARR